MTLSCSGVFFSLIITSEDLHISQNCTIKNIVFFELQLNKNMNLSTLLTSVVFLLVHFASSQDYIFDWANSAGSGSRDYGHTIIVDSAGNSYSAGKFQGVADFDPGQNVSNLSSLGGYDCFLLKHDPLGNLVWAKSIGGLGDDGIQTIIFDSIGNILVIGQYEGTVDFDPNSGVVLKTATSSSREIFVLKLTSNGNFLWVKVFAGSTYSSYGTDIKCDANGNIYTCGYFSGSVDFDPGSQTYQLSATALWDLFVQKMDANGNFQWAKKFGGNGYNYRGSIDINQQGDVFFTALFANLVDFDPNAGIFNIATNGGDDAFLLKLSSSGNLLWVKTFGGGGNDIGHDVVSDSAGYVYILGDFKNNVDFDPSTNTVLKSSAGQYDVFVVKLSPTGNFQWVRTFGGTGYDNGNSIDISPNGDLVISGTYQNTVDFDPSINTFSLTSNGDYDAFLLWLDLNGNFKDAKSLGGPGFERPDNFCFDLVGNMYITGAHSQQADFDPGLATHVLPHQGDWDIFNMKLSICYPNSAIDTIMACDSYTWIDGVTYTSNNYSATDTLTNINGCDSVVTLNLTISNTKYGVDSIVTCPPFTWIDSVTYTSSNQTAIHTLSAINGCDSVVSLHLTILPTSNIIDSVASCHPYKWIDGITYSSNDTAILNYANNQGCDSTITLYFTWFTIDLNVTKHANRFTVSESSYNVTYQWLNCDSNLAPIQGATQRSFSAPANGNYAVAVTKQGCTDTSQCQNINNVKLSPYHLSDKLRFYPNPSNGKLTLHFDDTKPVTVKVFDSSGKLLYVKSNILSSGSLLDIILAPGIYIISFENESERVSHQLIMK